MTDDELTELDLAVARLVCDAGPLPPFRWVVDGMPPDVFAKGRWHKYSPSRDWSDAGPLVERYNVAVWPIAESGHYEAEARYWDANGGLGGDTARHFVGLGPTPMVAICRAVVAIKAGDWVVDGACDPDAHIDAVMLERLYKL